MNADRSNPAQPAASQAATRSWLAAPTASFDHAGQLLSANHAWLAMMRPGGNAPAGINDQLVRYLARALAGEEVVARACFTGPQGLPQDYEIRAQPMFDADGHTASVMLSCWHAQDRSPIEAEAVALRTGMATITKEMEGLCYSISHDLRAPLRAIDGFAGMLMRRADERLDDEDKRLLGVVRESGKTASRLIEKLLSLSRTSQQTMAPATTDVTSLVRDAWLDVGNSFSGEFEVETLPSVWGDRPLLKQIWLQLLGNAIKFHLPGATPRIRVSGRREGNECIYEVHDNGVGFDARYTDKLFKVFQRLHGPDEFPGDGIGLAIVARIVARHGGRVWANGERGSGASFGFALPHDTPLSAGGVVNSPVTLGG